MSLRSSLSNIILGESSTSQHPPSAMYPPPGPQHFPPPHHLPLPQHFPPPRTPSPSFRQPSPSLQQPLPSIPWLLIDKEEVRSSQTNTPLFHITLSAAPGSWSSKSLVTLTRASTGLPLGSIRIRSSTEVIELEVNGGATTMKEDSMWASFRWYIHPVVYPGAKWVWSESKGGFRLTDGDKNGRLLATVEGKTLVCENVGLPEAAVDEVVLSAVAVLIKKKRLGKEREAVEGFGELAGALAGS
ncbi:uncharacterized protein LTR77_008629 [Saxophila tyrrhenica]|uniref:Uncharacterized protein n=1 Tax=Saxophila tyrrhenica TaxID=1690608 RepID=A0AAV9P2L9_9PEZI|nr:hypothetical protein LTR77_008629 [Saxophila tyrrhenica]